MQNNSMRGTVTGVRLDDVLPLMQPWQRDPWGMLRPPVSPEALLTCAAYAPMLLLCCALCFLPDVRRIPLKRFAAPVLMLLCLAALASQGYAPFVYFQF